VNTSTVVLREDPAPKLRAQVRQISALFLGPASLLLALYSMIVLLI